MHGFDRVRPAWHPIQFIKQLIRIVCDLHKPLRNFAALYKRIGAPPSPINNLLIGQHGLINRVPVNDRILAVNEALLEHLRKQPLFPPIILGAASCDFTCPVVTVTQSLELTAHVLDIAIRPFCRWNAALDRRIFRGHSECIPAHRLQDMLTLQTMVTRDDIV